MKIRALGNLSGAVGDKAKGEEFNTDATTGQALIDRGLAVKVEGQAPALQSSEKAEKLAKAKE